MGKARRKFTGFLFLAVSGLGFVSIMILLNDPTPTEVENPSALFQLNSSVLSSARDIASTDSSPGLTSLNLHKMECNETPEHFETAAYRFRIKADSCNVDPMKVEIKNKSNGYVATVFQTKPMAITTDFINLSEGKNEIEVKFDNTDAGMSKTITVVRTPSSVKK